MDLGDPTATALRVVDALDGAGQRYALCGGLLVGAYGEPRETVDADFAVTDLTAAALQEALRRGGFEADVAFDGLRIGGVFVGRVTLLPGGGDTGLNVAALVRPRSPRYASLAVGRAERRSLRGTLVPMLSAEDFVLFKALSTRPRDTHDAASVLVRMGEWLERDAIEREVVLLKDEVPDFDVRASWAEIVALSKDPFLQRTTPPD